MVQPLVAGWGATRRTFPVVVAGDRVTHCCDNALPGDQMCRQRAWLCVQRVPYAVWLWANTSPSVPRFPCCGCSRAKRILRTYRPYAIYVLSITVQLLLLIIKKIPKKLSPIPFIVPKAIPSTKFHHLQLSTTLWSLRVQ